MNRIVEIELYYVSKKRRNLNENLNQENMEGFLRVNSMLAAIFQF